MGYNHIFSEDELISSCFKKYPALTACREDILKAADAITECYQNGGTVFTCGNGGSSSDSAHIVGELLKGFLSSRPLSEEDRKKFSVQGELGELCADKLQGSLPAVDLTSQSAIIAAIANDTDPRLVYAQQLWGLGRSGDILIGISTSGNAANVVCAGFVAKQHGLISIALTGESGGKIGQSFDIAIKVPSSHTPDVQELHLPVYHLLCALCESRLFSKYL